MTRAITSGELAKLRSDNQWARWHVIIDKPDVVYTARTTGALEKTTAWTLGFDTGSGTLTNCLAGMTVLIGSSAGGWDRGIGRLRKNATGGDAVFYLGADPSIFCYDNDYITVLNDFAPWSRHPIGANIDVDVAYSDQFDDFIPVPVFGERIAVIDAGDTIGFNAAASWVPGSTISGYAWTFSGATSSTGTTTATPTATYETSGRFRVVFTVTAANGKTATGYGWVYVLGDNLAPDAGTSIDNVEGESEIGWSCKVMAYDRPTIKDRARVVIYSEDFFSGEAESLGPVTGRENIVMAGWIVGETIIRQPGHDYVEFTVGGPGVFCGNVATMPAGLTDSALPTDDGVTLEAWAKMSSLTITKGLHYLVNYRTTLPVCVDVEIEDWDWPAHKLTADNETLWGQLETFANHGILTCTPDRYAHLYIQRDAALYPFVDRTADIPVVMTFADGDWSDEATANRRHSSEISMTEAEGTIFTGGYVFPLGGRSPGDVAGSFGVIENITEVNWPDSGTALGIAGMMAGNASAEYESIGIIHPANNHFIDVAPRQYVNVIVDGDTLRCIPRRVTLARDDSGPVAVELDLEPEGGQWSAVSIEYPNEGSPPVEPPEEPPTPPAPPTDPPEDPPESSEADAVVAVADDVRITDDLDEASPTWTSVISGGPAGEIIDAELSEIDNDVYYVLADDGVWKTDNLTGGADWTQVYDIADFTLGTDVKFYRIRLAPGSSTLVYVIASADDDGTRKVCCGRSSNGGETWTWNAIGEVDGNVRTINIDNTIDLVQGGTTTTIESYEGGTGITFEVEFTGGTFQYTKAQAWCELDPQPDWGSWLAFSYDFLGESPSQGYDTDGDRPPRLQYQSFGRPVRNEVETPIDGGYHIEGEVNYTEANFADKLFRLGWESTSVGRWENSESATRLGTVVNFTLNGVTYSGEPSYAFDVARTNNQWLYLGTPDGIYKSENGGFDWTLVTDDHGALDICVDPQLAGVIYYIATDQALYLRVNGLLQGAALDSGLGWYGAPLRVARDLNSGRLYVLKGGVLRCRNLGVWTDSASPGMLYNPRALHAYVGGKIIFLGSVNIYYSDDYGATFTSKNGGWAYGGGAKRNAHLMRSTT